jgi:hypothetical protein
MTQQFKKKIGYWFFMLAGIVVIVLQILKYYNDTLEMTFSQGIITAFAGMFIFKPMLIVELFEDLRNKFKTK